LASIAMEDRNTQKINVLRFVEMEEELVKKFVMMGIYSVVMGVMNNVL
jgi:hypothetical protein